MTPAARIKTITEILEKISISKVPMDSTVGDYMRRRRYIGSKDRANLAERTYDITRHFARISWWLELLKIKDTPRNRVLIWLALGEKKDQQAIEKLFDGSKYGSEVLTTVEKKWLAKLQGKKLQPREMPEAVQVECPLSYEEKLRAYFGDHFREEMEAMIAGATLDLRVNTWRSDREKVMKYMEDDGVKTTPTPYTPFGLRVDGKVFLSKTKAFKKGWVEIQDEGSQLVARICGVQPGMHVLDYCAGAGGKTLALAAAMQNKGRIVAMDINGRRLEKSRSRFKRAGVHDIIELRALEESKNRKWLRRQKGTFDVVLTDVPCTGTGTWRRNPDMRWRVYGPSLEELCGIQKEILDKVAKAVKPGGRLIYATCSLLPDENEFQIEAFLKRHGEFQLVTVEKCWPEEGALPCTGDYMRLTPLRHNTDSFFAAVLERKKEKEAH